MVNKRKIVHLISGLLFCTLQLVLPPLSLSLPFLLTASLQMPSLFTKLLVFPLKTKKKKEGRKEGDTNKLPWYDCLTCYLLLLSSSSRDHQYDLLLVLHMLSSSYQLTLSPCSQEDHQ